MVRMHHHYYHHSADESKYCFELEIELEVKQVVVDCFPCQTSD